LTQNQPTFSICIPNYNYGHLIGDTLQSVLDQSYPHFEIIVADNASTDDSVAVVEKFKDPRIRLYQNRYNIGFAPNLQRVTQYAQNDLINLLSSDDQMKPGALETFVEVIQQAGADVNNVVLYSDTEYFDNDNRITGYQRKVPGAFDLQMLTSPPAPSPDLKFEVYTGRDVLKGALSRLRAFAPMLSTVYSRALWQAVEGYNNTRTIGPDKHFGYKLLGQNPQVIYIARALYRYRFLTSANFATQFSTLKQVSDDYLYTLEWSAKDLNALGLSQKGLIHTFIKKRVIEYALRQLGKGHYANGFRLFCYAFASYPGTALRIPKTYAVLGLLMMGPLSKVVAPLLFRAYRNLSE